MKVTINTTEPQSMEIDWSKKMIVKSETDNYIMTTGIHSHSFFTGVSFRDGYYSASWSKSAFTPCTTPVTITFENEL